MDSRIPGVLKDLHGSVNFRGVDHSVATVEIDEKGEFKVLDQTNELDEDLIGEELDLSLLAFVQQIGPGQDTLESRDNDLGSYYCVVSGEVEDKDLREEEIGDLNILDLDIGPGSVMVHFETAKDFWNEIDVGEELSILAKRIMLLDIDK